MTPSRRRPRRPLRRPKEPYLERVDWGRAATLGAVVLVCLIVWLLMAWGALVLFRRLHG